MQEGKRAGRSIFPRHTHTPIPRHVSPKSAVDANVVQIVENITAFDQITSRSLPGLPMERYLWQPGRIIVQKVHFWLLQAYQYEIIDKKDKIQVNPDPCRPFFYLSGATYRSSFP